MCHVGQKVKVFDFFVKIQYLRKIKKKKFFVKNKFQNIYFSLADKTGGWACQSALSHGRVEVAVAHFHTFVELHGISN